MLNATKPPDLAYHFHGDHLFLLLLKNAAGQWNTLVSFKSALARLDGQFSVGVNTWGDRVTFLTSRELKRLALPAMRQNRFYRIEEFVVQSFLILFGHGATLEAPTSRSSMALMALSASLRASQDRIALTIDS
jgi:hypothetical protein